MGVPKTSTGIPLVQSDYIEGSRITVISPNFCDRTTWYQGSVRVNNEILSASSARLFVPADSHAWVDVTHGKITGERQLRGSYSPIVKINDVTKEESDPGTTNGDYNIDYRLGKITFNYDLQPTDVVKASYNWVSGSQWSIIPDQGKKIRITEAEVQFSEYVVLKDTVIFQLYVGGQPYGAASYYQTMYDFINESNRSYPMIPPLGGSDWRGMSGSVCVFRWDYKATLDLKSSYGMEIRVRLENDTEFGGNYAVATLYGISTDE